MSAKPRLILSPDDQGSPEEQDHVAERPERRRFDENPLAFLTGAIGASVASALGLFFSGLPVWIVVLGVWAMIVVGSLSVRGPISRGIPGIADAGRNTGLYGWALLGVGASLVMMGLMLLVQDWAGLILLLSYVLGFAQLLRLGPQPRETRLLPPVDVTQWDDEDPDDADDPDLVPRVFTWRVNALAITNEHRDSVGVSESAYHRMRSRNPFSSGQHPPNSELARWVPDGWTRDVARAAAVLRKTSQAHSYSSFAEMSSILAFAQSVEYKSDEETRGVPEFWKYAVETLYDQTGDCDDTTVLAASLLRELGHGVVILVLPEHAAVGIRVPSGVPGNFVTFAGERYFFGETTAEGWRIGDMPSQLSDADVMILPVSTKPI